MHVESSPPCFSLRSSVSVSFVVARLFGNQRGDAGPQGSSLPRACVVYGFVSRSRSLKENNASLWLRLEEFLFVVSGLHGTGTEFACKKEEISRSSFVAWNPLYSTLLRVVELSSSLSKDVFLPFPAVSKPRYPLPCFCMKGLRSLLKKWIFQFAKSFCVISDNA